eukprot:CAMPEP_0116088654 /NCGR_PEP_ID=MMETSP0327-20121206/5984_1 /TAXON_ID=44447 /ORGANISM="Pseudo-nitzschia delicatissima, Strain B596" /LENGTH=537 /DNA_ID=CAMNT_0003579747 /DNA_START=73 /DNA_END=1686 /DNA_ORIENTATION=-
MIGYKMSQFFLLSSIFLVGKIDFLADATSIKMDYLPIGHGRVDPILSYDCPSDHVHTFYGPQSGMDPRRNDVNNPLELHTRLRNTPVSENTGNVEENKSMYWHPTVYKYNRNTGIYTRDIMAQSSAYYIWDTGETTAFPNGFEMIGGFDTAKASAVAECVNEQPCESGDCYTESTFFPAAKCDELEVSMRMPDCWDGVSVNSPPRHTAHVTYSNDGDCPASHPVKIPRIELFFRIMPYDGGWHTFADGSNVFHADYVSGWDETFLQNLLNNCSNDGDGAMPNHFCEDILTYRDAPKCTDDSCDFSDPQLLEKVKAFQPSPALDVQGTIIAEETAVIGQLPRGTCNGNLVGGTSPTTAPVPAPTANPTLPPQPEPTDAPVPSPTTAPVPAPTTAPVPSPTTAPVPAPTTAPVPAPTTAPVPAPTSPPQEEPNDECLDDTDLAYQDVAWKNCDWVGRKYFKRCFFEWEGAELWEYCPGACRECTCFDDDDLAFKRDPNKNCDWVAKNKAARCEKNWKGHSLDYFCPVTCDLCEYDIGNE